MESGDLFVNSAETAARMTSTLASRLNCTSASRSCFLKQNLSNLLKEADQVAPPFPSAPGYIPFISPTWWPVLDEDEIFRNPLTMFREGQFHRDVEILIGTNNDEGTRFVYPYYDFMNKSLYRTWLTTLLTDFSYSGRSPGMVQAALQRFPPKEGDNRASASRILGDYAFTCIARSIASNVARHGGTVFSYRFNAKAADDTTPSEEGVIHGADVPFVWDHGDWEGAASHFRPPEERLAESIGNAWTQFASEGRPTSDPSHWPRFAREDDVVAVLDFLPDGSNTSDASMPFVLERGWRKHTCAFWQNFLTGDIFEISVLV